MKYPLARKNPDPKPDDVCACGHKRMEHNYTTTVAGQFIGNACGVYEVADLGDLNCGCLAFDDPKEPQYRHDCDACQFLGRFSYDAPLADGSTTPMNVDLYFCTGGPSSLLGGTIIARHDSKAPEYASMPRDILKMMLEEMAKRGHNHATFTHALAEGFERAKGLK